MKYCFTCTKKTRQGNSGVRSKLAVKKKLVRCLKEGEPIVGNIFGLCSTTFFSGLNA